MRKKYSEGNVLNGAEFIVRCLKKSKAIFKCKCGNTFERDIYSQIKGTGVCNKCYSSLVGKWNIKHGMANKTKKYKLWVAIKDRCFNEKCKEYRFYGGRGIVMIEEWKNSFDAFNTSVPDPPTKYHSFDRIDNNRGYEPGNVRWATKKEQANNRRSNSFLTYKEETNTYSYFSEKYGLSQDIIYSRKKAGWPDDKIIETPAILNKKPVLNLLTGIFYDSIGEAARVVGMKDSQLKYRLLNNKQNKTPFIFV
jgi:hypothetical protein